MIRTVIRWLQGPECDGTYNDIAKQITSFEDEVNQHSNLGWKVISSGVYPEYIYAILEKDVS